MTIIGSECSYSVTSLPFKRSKKSTIKIPDGYDDDSLIMALADDGLLEERKKEAEFELTRKKDLHEFEMKSKEMELARREKELDLERDKLAYEREKLAKEAARDDKINALLEFLISRRK